MHSASAQPSPLVTHNPWPWYMRLSGGAVDGWRGSIELRVLILNGIAPLTTSFCKFLFERNFMTLLKTAAQQHTNSLWKGFMFRSWHPPYFDFVLLFHIFHLSFSFSTQFLPVTKKFKVSSEMYFVTLLVKVSQGHNYQIATNKTCTEHDFSCRLRTWVGKQLQTNFLWAIGFFSCRLCTWVGKQVQTNYPWAMGLFSCRSSVQLTWNKLLALKPKEHTHVQMKMCSIQIITGAVLHCAHGFDWSLVVNVNHELTCEVLWALIVQKNLFIWSSRAWAKLSTSRSCISNDMMIINIWNWISAIVSKQGDHCYW